MRLLQLIFCASLAVSGVALAQSTSVQGNASTQSNTSVSADRSGATASHESAWSAGVASDHAAANLAQGTEMNATLSRSVDTRRAKPGDEVTATLAQDVQANGAVVLRRGTRLIGRVTEAQPRVRGSGSGEGHSDSRLGIVFERALVDGREVPVHAMIQAVAAADAVGSSSFDSGSCLPAATAASC